MSSSITEMNEVMFRTYFPFALEQNVAEQIEQQIRNKDRKNSKQLRNDQFSLHNIADFTSYEPSSDLPAVEATEKKEEMPKTRNELYSRIQIEGKNCDSDIMEMEIQPFSQEVDSEDKLQEAVISRPTSPENMDIGSHSVASQTNSTVHVVSEKCTFGGRDLTYVGNDNDTVADIVHVDPLSLNESDGHAFMSETKIDAGLKAIHMEDMNIEESNVNSLIHDLTFSTADGQKSKSDDPTYFLGHVLLSQTRKENQEARNYDYCRYAFKSMHEAENIKRLQSMDKEEHTADIRLKQNKECSGRRDAVDRNYDKDLIHYNVANEEQSFKKTEKSKVKVQNKTELGEQSNTSNNINNVEERSVETTRIPNDEPKTEQMTEYAEAGAIPTENGNTEEEFEIIKTIDHNVHDIIQRNLMNNKDQLPSSGKETQTQQNEHENANIDGQKWVDSQRMPVEATQSSNFDQNDVVVIGNTDSSLQNYLRIQRQKNLPSSIHEAQHLEMSNNVVSTSFSISEEDFHSDQINHQRPVPEQGPHDEDKNDVKQQPTQQLSTSNSTVGMLTNEIEKRRSKILHQPTEKVPNKLKVRPVPIQGNKDGSGTRNTCTVDLLTIVFLNIVLVSPLMMFFVQSLLTVFNTVVPDLFAMYERQNFEGIRRKWAYDIHMDTLDFHGIDTCIIAQPFHGLHHLCENPRIPENGTSATRFLRISSYVELQTPSRCRLDSSVLENLLDDAFRIDSSSSHYTAEEIPTHTEPPPMIIADFGRRVPLVMVDDFVGVINIGCYRYIVGGFSSFYDGHYVARMYDHGQNLSISECLVFTYDNDVGLTDIRYNLGCLSLVFLFRII